MWYSLFLYMIISILIIYITHQLWIYMTNKYTTKKYLVGSQIEKYKKLLERQSSHQVEFISEEEQENMKEKLIHFINSQE